MDGMKGKGGLQAAVAEGAEKALNFLKEKERDIVSGTKRGLRRVLGIKPGPKPPIANMTDGEKNRYEEFKKLMDSLPPPMPWQDAVIEMYKTEIKMFEKACELYGCDPDKVGEPEPPQNESHH